MVVLMTARPALRSPLGRASEIGKRRNLCGCSRWGSKCGCDVLSLNQEQSLLFEGCDPPENAAQMLRAFGLNGENQNDFATPSGEKNYVYTGRRRCETFSDPEAGRQARRLVPFGKKGRSS